MAGADCNDYICSNDKDEKQLQEVMSMHSSGSSGPSPQQSVMKEKPLNAIELGRSTWPILHRLTLSYPEQPTDLDKTKALGFIQSFSKLYPCRICASDFQEKIKDHPPKLDSREDFALWMCEQHNIVNEKLGKPLFRCTLRRMELIHGLPHRKKWTDSSMD